jgi:hypothetical protein
MPCWEGKARRTRRARGCGELGTAGCPCAQVVGGRGRPQSARSQGRPCGGWWAREELNLRPLPCQINAPWMACMPDGQQTVKDHRKAAGERRLWRPSAPTIRHAPPAIVPVPTVAICCPSAARRSPVSGVIDHPAQRGSLWDRPVTAPCGSGFRAPVSTASGHDSTKLHCHTSSRTKLVLRSSIAVNKGEFSWLATPASARSSP